MPDFGRTLSDAEISALVAYIRSIDSEGGEL